MFGQSAAYLDVIWIPLMLHHHHHHCSLIFSLRSVYFASLEAPASHSLKEGESKRRMTHRSLISCVCVCVCMCVCVCKSEEENKNFVIYVSTQCLPLSDLCGPLSTLSTVMCALKMYIFGPVCVCVCVCVCRAVWPASPAAHQWLPDVHPS